MFEFKVGDKVWHINQYGCMTKNRRPFTVYDIYEYDSIRADYVIKQGTVYLLVKASDLIKVVK